MQIKQPFETIRLVLAFGVALASIDSATVVARELVSGGAAIALGGAAIAGTNVTVDLSAGADGERYLVTVRATGAGGESLEREAELAVVDLSWAVPSVSSPYLTAAAFVDRIGLDDAIRLASTDGVRIDAARLQGALTDAQAETDGYLAGRFATPLSSVPALISTIVFDLAVARLYTGEPPKSVADRRDRAQAQLRDIAKGIITVPGADLLPPTTSPAGLVLFEVDAPVFTRDRLTGF